MKKLLSINNSMSVYQSSGRIWLINMLKQKKTTMEAVKSYLKNILNMTDEEINLFFSKREG